MHPVVRTVLQRLGLGLVTLFFVSIIIFSAVEMLPGDFAKAILGQAATPETVAAFDGRSASIARRSSATSMDRRRPAGDFGQSFASRSRLPAHRRRDHRAAPLQHAVPRVMAALIAVPLALALGIAGRPLPQ